MLRAILLLLSKSRWLRNLITRWGFARKASSRFVAGDTIPEVLEVIEVLNRRGMYATVDHLGEDVTDGAEALRAKDDYLRLLDSLGERQLDSNASVKLTQLGLNVDYSLCLDNMRAICSRAGQLDMMVRVDIEDSSTVDRTWQIFRDLQAESCTNVCLAVQSYMYRSEQDVTELLAAGARFRLCKGAYNEPPEVAYPKKSDVDANYDRLTMLLLERTKALGDGAPNAAGKQPPIAAIATHDEARIDFAKRAIFELGLLPQAMEFQMLYGIRPDLQMRLVEQGYPVRIYVPYGTEWYPYYMRRLAERPANLWFLISNLLRR